jgi:lysozyme
LFRPTAYRPTKKDVWTCGWGHTQGVMESTTCDYARAQAWIVEDVLVAVNAINSAVKVPLTQNQFDALVSFVFNIGVTHFLTSTLLKDLNAGQYVKAADAMLQWEYQDHAVLQGLERRREQERALFLAP